MSTQDTTKKPARKMAPRKVLPDDQKRSEVLSMRVYPDVKAKIQANGTAWLEAVVREARGLPGKPKA